MTPFPIKNLLFGLVGACVGAVAGVFAYTWIANQGMYAAVLPGAMVGLGFGLAARKRNIAFGIIAGVIGGAATLYAEWKVFCPNLTSSEFVSWYSRQNSMTWILLAISIIMAFSFGMGRERYDSSPPKSDA